MRGLPPKCEQAPADRQTQIPHFVRDDSRAFRDDNCDAWCSGHVRKKERLRHLAKLGVRSYSCSDSSRVIQSAQRRLKPERVERGFFRSAEAFLPRMNAGLPPKFEQPLIEARELSDVLMGRLVLTLLI